MLAMTENTQAREIWAHTKVRMPQHESGELRIHGFHKGGEHVMAVDRREVEKDFHSRGMQHVAQAAHAWRHQLLCNIIHLQDAMLLCACFSIPGKTSTSSAAV